MERSEKVGLGVATAGHLVLFGLLSVGFLATPNPDKLKQQPVEVSLVPDVALEAATPSATEAPSQAEAPETGTPADAPPPEAAPANAAPQMPAPAPIAPIPTARPAPPDRPAPRPEPRPEPRPQPRPEPKAEPKAEPKPQPARPVPKPVARPKPAATPKPAPTRIARAEPKPAAKAPAKPAPARRTRTTAAPAKTAARPATRSAATSSASGRGTTSAARPSATRGQGQTASARPAAPRASRLGPDFLKGLTAEKTQTKASAAPPAAARVDARTLASIVQAIARQIQPCADKQVDPGPGANQITTTLNLRLNRDGTLSATPRMVRQTGVSGENERYAERVADLGVAAFRACSPLRLPAEYYSTSNGGWSNINYNWKLR